MSSELRHVYHSLAVRRSVLYLDLFPARSDLIERVVIVSGHLLLKCSRRHVDQRALQADLIVMGSPVTDDGLRIGPVFEPVLVQTTVPNASIEAFSKHVLGWLGPA